jgi:hypothetical protein
MGERTFGLRDIPVQDMADESLGLREYAEALTEFVLKCDTPITVALQGDWGSGKTSLLNLVLQGVKKKEGAKAKIVWFNTWQYSQFSMDDSLAVSLISRFVEAVGEGQPDSPAKKCVAFLGKWGKLVATAAAKGVAAQAGAEKIVEGMTASGDAQTDPSREIEKLKTSMLEMVEKSSSERIVVFVDDLDRLVPIRAVELLENLKIFLDLPKCVFLLACDYKVVVQGLKEKFNVSEGETKGRSFFDKIIQVPFNMPLAQYQVHLYLKRLLGSIGVEIEGNDVEDYVDLANHSTGFNPRGMKRLFNSLFLLKLVAQRNKLLERVKDWAGEREVSKILFGVLCMQNSYEPLYQYLSSVTEINDALFEKLRDPQMLQTDSAFVRLRSDFRHVDQDLYRRLSEFTEAFYRSIQLASDASDEQREHLSESEIQNLRTILSFSSVVSTTGAERSVDLSERSRNRGMMKALAQKLNQRHQAVLQCHLKALNRGHFYTYQEKSEKVTAASVCLYSKEREIGIFFRFDTSDATAWIYSWREGCIESTSTWVKENLCGVFPDLRLDGKDKDHIAELFSVKYPPDATREEKSVLFSEKVFEVSDKFMPVFARSHSPAPVNAMENT